jgi:hypothetical protein
VESDDSVQVLEGASRWGIRYALLSRTMLERYPGFTLEAIAARSHMALVHEHRTPTDFFALLRLESADR